MPKFPNAVGGSYVSESPIADCERTVNWYVEKTEVPGAKAKAVLYPAPGVKRFATTSALNGRGLFAQNNYVLAAIGEKLFRLNALGVTTDIGTLKTDNNPVTMCTNGEAGGQAFVTSGGNGYIVNIADNAFSQVRTGATTMGAMLDSYFLALDGNTSTLFLSDLTDGTIWDPTQFARSTIAPDPWIAMAVNYREIWLFGTETSEVWVNVGSFPFPFAPHPSGLVPYGIAAPFSVKNVAGTLIWLARTANGSGQVVSATGFTPEPISTHALQVAINSYGRIDDAIADTFQMLGHSFYVLTFPSAQKTWVFDTTTRIWVEWLTWVPSLNEYIAWRPLFHAWAFDKHLVLDRAAGNIYETSHELTTDVDDRFIRRLRVFPGLVNELNRTFYDYLGLYLEVGLGLPVGQGSDPQVMLRASDDGGKTYGTERWCGAGREGRYKTLVEWYRLGSGRDRVFEVSVTDPIPWRLVDAFIKIRKGEH
jgi:hypothetical protein